MREEVRFLDSLQGSGIRPGLTRMRKLLAAAGNPERAFPSIIVAGTNGKGSTCATLAAILREAGYRTGFYSSPHLVTLLERWRIDDRPVRRARFIEAVHELQRLVRRTRVNPTYFEALTLLAFFIFRDEKCDVAVMEVGMGGRLDATNVCRPIASLITSISRDHVEYLGNTLSSIAYEKAGVIHRGQVAALTSNRNSTILRELRRRARQVKVHLHPIWRETAIAEAVTSLEGTAFSFRTPESEYALKTPLAGEHQLENVALAVRAAEMIRKRLPRISFDAITRGVATTSWRARLERFRMNGKVVIVDGAHNIGAAQRLAAFVGEYLPLRRTLVFAIMRDKEIAPVIATLVPLFDDVIVCNADPVRGMDTRSLAAHIRRLGVAVSEASSPAAAIRQAIESSSDCAVVAGSLYLAGDAVAFLDRQAAARAKTSVANTRSIDTAAAK